MSGGGSNASSDFSGVNFYGRPVFFLRGRNGFGLIGGRGRRFGLGGGVGESSLWSERLGLVGIDVLGSNDCFLSSESSGISSGSSGISLESPTCPKMGRWNRPSNPRIRTVMAKESSLLRESAHSFSEGRARRENRRFSSASWPVMVCPFS